MNSESNTRTVASAGFVTVHVTVVTPVAVSHTGTPDASTHGPAGSEDVVVVGPAASQAGTSTVGDTDCDHAALWKLLEIVTARAGPTIVDVAVAEAPGPISTPSGPNTNSEPNTLTVASAGFDHRPRHRRHPGRRVTHRHTGRLHPRPRRQDDVVVVLPLHRPGRRPSVTPTVTTRRCGSRW